MRTEDAVRESLARAAALADPVPLSGLDLREAPRRRVPYVRPRTVALAVAYAVVLALLVVPLVRPDVTSLPPASSSVDTWPARGDLAADAAFVAEARRAWDVAPVYAKELPHSDVRVLLATDTDWGRYVMLTGRNALGQRRLAVLSDKSTDMPPYGTRLRLRSDTPFPSTKLLAYLEQRRIGSVETSLLMVAAPPGVTRLRWQDNIGRDWHELPAVGGAGATVVSDSQIGFGIRVNVRAYRGWRRAAAEYFYPPREIYEPDPMVAVPAACGGGSCASGRSLRLSADTTTLTDPPTSGDQLWQDMADQALQLWRNRASVAGSDAYSFQYGWSRLLDDGTGLNLFHAAEHGGPDRFVLYVDRPEWPVGRLYLDRPFRASGRVRAVSAVVPIGSRHRLVAVVAEGTSFAYRIRGGAWRDVRVDDRVATALLPPGADPAEVEVRVTARGRAEVGPPDTVAPLPPA